MFCILGVFEKVHLVRSDCNKSILIPSVAIFCVDSADTKPYASFVFFASVILQILFNKTYSCSNKINYPQFLLMHIVVS